MIRRRARPASRALPSSWKLGVAALLVLLAVAALSFTKRVPFTHDHRLNATVTSSAGLRKGSPVRIAGVDVGKVVGLGAGPGGTRVVELELKDRGLPVHRDATLRIRPRLFLEGGYFVELSPGSPSGPVLAEDATLPVAQTTVPVQFDQALGTLDSSGRDSLKGIITELDEGLGDGGASDLALLQRPLARTLRDGAIVARAARGTRSDDLSRTVTGAARVTQALAGRATELGGTIDATATTAEALAAEEAGLRATLRGLDVLARDVPGRLETIAGDVGVAGDSLAVLRPGLRRARTSLPGVTRLLRELQLAARPAELPGLLADLRPTLATLPPLATGLTALLPNLTPVVDCVRDRAVPVLEAKLQDGALSTGRMVWQEAAAALPGLAGASGSYDANGAWVRYNAGLGDQTISTGSIPGIGGTLAAATNSPPLGSRPTWLGTGRTPPFRPDVPCRENALPDLQARTSGGSAAPRTGASRRVRTSRSRLRAMLAAPGRFGLRPAPGSGRR